MLADMKARQLPMTEAAAKAAIVVYLAHGDMAKVRVTYTVSDFTQPPQIPPSLSVLGIPPP